MNVQQLLVASIVILSAAWAIRRIIRTPKRKTCKHCSTPCTDCHKSHSSHSKKHRKKD